MPGLFAPKLVFAASVFHPALIFSVTRGCCLPATGQGCALLSSCLSLRFGVQAPISIGIDFFRAWDFCSALCVLAKQERAA
jgi:hypothetical protein